jgi:hypothetical protein
MTFRKPYLDLDVPPPTKVWLEAHFGFGRQISQVTLQRLFVAADADLVWAEQRKRVLALHERAIEHGNLAVIKTHQLRTHDVHCKGIVSSNDEACALGFSSHRPVPIHAANTVNHREVTFGCRPQRAVGIRIEEDAVQIERHSPACIVAMPIAAAYDFFGIAKNSVADAL